MARSRRSQKNRVSAAMELPNEIIDLIIGYLDDRQDIFALTRICRNWSRCAIRKLYTEIQLTLSHDCKNLAPLERMIISSGVNLEPTTGIAILPRHTLPNSCPTILPIFGGADADDSKQSVMPAVQPPNDSLNLLIRVLLGKISKNSLKYFNWAHDYSIEPETFIKLTQVHGESLRGLQLRNCKGEWKNVSPLTAGLQHLSVCAASSATFKAGLVAANSSTLRNLELGFEDLVVHDFMGLYLSHFDQQTNKSLRFCQKLAEWADPADISVPVLKLESLKIVGWDLRPLFNGSFRPITDFNSLTSLTLESCCGLSDALPMLARKSGDQVINRLPNLQSLTIRREIDDNPEFTRVLDHFLRNLSPLRSLHILLSGYYNARSSKEFLKIHGATLQTLVWDERLGRRHDLIDDRLVDLRDAGKLGTIVKYCPNLVELGIPVRWSSGEDVPPEGHRKHVIGLLAKLKHLKTLNIRNMPRLYPCCLKVSHVETMLYGLAYEIVKDLFHLKKSKNLPQLRIIGLGALVYREVWDGSVVDGVDGLDNVLRLRIWAIVYPQDVLGKHTPLLTQVASGYPGNVGKDISENMSIFKPYWLN